MAVPTVLDSAVAFQPSSLIYSLPPAQVFAALATRLAGLTQAEAADRLQQAGPNRIQEARRTPLWLKFAANFTHLMAILLWVAGALAFVAGMPQLGIAVWLVILVNGIFSFWQEYKAEQATEALRKLLPIYAHVLRDGVECRILADVLVPGDLMLLSEGDAISADGRLVQEAELRIDQSTLSGEAHPVRKSAEPLLGEALAYAELPNLVFAGTHVAAGTGRAVVFATGMATEFGKIAGMTQAIGNQLSPLQKEIQILTRVVSIFAVVTGLLFFAVAVLAAGMSWIEGFIFGIGMIVAFVPEGLLPTVTLALAMGVQRMVARHALVKRLSSVETLGCTTVICTDKTGTLTQNEMTVRELWVAGRRIAVTGAGYTPEGQLVEDGVTLPAPDADLRGLLATLLLCNNARLVPPDGETPRWTILGDPTEAALRVVAAEAGLNELQETQRMPRLREIPFESSRKRMSTLHRQGGATVALVKGAPRELLALSTCVRRQGTDVALDAESRGAIGAAVDDMARRGLRVLAAAERVLPPDMQDLTAEAVERELTFLGLVGMMDPPRPEVARAVESCRRAGIRIVMITGDYGLTAESIARRIGIVTAPLPRIVTGAELEQMDAAALRQALGGEVIFARVSPDHKLRIVGELQAMGEVVAVTGDGVNDAPALKRADIGVAMGVTGTDVAKEAADVVLTDDNFASIVAAVEEGRAVYANIKKFTSYILTSNVPEAVPFIAFALTGGRIPLALNVMQILAIDLGTDIVPALALGIEPPEPGVMAQRPRRLSDHVVDRPLLVRAYLVQGVVEGLACMAAFFFLYWTNGYWGQWLDLPGTGWIYHAAAAMALAAVVCGQIGNLFAHRSASISAFRFNPFANRLIWLGIGVELALVLLLMYVPFLQTVFGMAPFPPQNWLFLLAWAPIVLGVDEIHKWVRRIRKCNHEDTKTRRITKKSRIS